LQRQKRFADILDQVKLRGLQLVEVGGEIIPRNDRLQCQRRIQRHRIARKGDDIGFRIAAVASVKWRGVRKRVTKQVRHPMLRTGESNIGEIRETIASDGDGRTRWEFLPQNDAGIDLETGIHHNLRDDRRKGGYNLCGKVAGDDRFIAHLDQRQVQFILRVDAVDR